MIHGNPQKNSGMWASRACEMENNGFICQRQQGIILISRLNRIFHLETGGSGFKSSCRLPRLEFPSGPAAYSRLPVKACGAGWNNLPGCGEEAGLDRRSAPLRVFERDPGHCEEPL